MRHYIVIQYDGNAPTNFIVDKMCKVLSENEVSFHPEAIVLTEKEAIAAICMRPAVKVENNDTKLADDAMRFIGTLFQPVFVPVTKPYEFTAQLINKLQGPRDEVKNRIVSALDILRRKENIASEEVVREFNFTPDMRNVCASVYSVIRV